MPVRVALFRSKPNAQGDVSNVFDIIRNTPHFARWFETKNIDITSLHETMNRSLTPGVPAESADFCWASPGKRSVFHTLFQTLSLIDTTRDIGRTTSEGLEAKAKELQFIQTYMSEQDVSAWSITDYHNEWLPNEIRNRTGQQGSAESGGDYW